MGEGGEARWEFLRQFQKKLAAKGWLTLGWPAEHGGLGASHMMQVIYNEEMSYHRAPDTARRRPGPRRPHDHPLRHRGAEAAAPPGHRRRRDCRGARASASPASGSDLASLQTRAVADGDDYVINGQKIWTSRRAQGATGCILLARTDPDAPKHRGISYFLLDMKTPGITVRPLINLAEPPHLQRGLLRRRARPARRNSSARRTAAGTSARRTLDFERSGINRVVAGIRIHEELVEYAAQARHNGGRIIDNGGVRHKLAELAIEFQAGRLLSYRVASMQARGQIPNAEASMSKLYGSELQQRLAGAGMQILGMSGQLAPGSRWTPMAGRLEQYYLFASALTVAAGTSEIMRGIIAGRGLGLPRG